MNATWDESETEPKYESGLPLEIHFWKMDGDIWLLIDRDRGFLSWERWKPGVAIKNVGLNG